MTNLQATCDELMALSREAALLASCSALLSWDEHTYMPGAGGEHRANQVALLAGMIHQRSTNPRIGDLLCELEHSSIVADIDSPTAANVRELRRSYDRMTKLPRELMEELARTTSLAQQEWIGAKQQADFKKFQPWLERIIRLKQQEAEALSPVGTPYDALLEEYEPVARSAELSGLFAALRRELVPFVAEITAARRQSDVSILKRSFDIERQRSFGVEVAGAVGFDFQHGRLDVTAHPFCTGIGPGDCRITTRFQPNNFGDSFFGILHEVGHGLYEQGLDAAHYGTPMGDAISLGVHESQSRMWENLVGRSRSFWQFFYPRACEVFPESLGDVPLDDFHFAINTVQPSLIRVQADEATYNLHIIIRFELEMALIAGDLRPSDVPGAWNEKYQHYLGLRPGNDAEGCLQDIHWSAGLIGYFPTYTLGNLIAAQLFAKADADLGGLNDAFIRGDFSGLLGWLRSNVHRNGKRYTASALIQRVTGAAPDHRPFLAALRAKFSGLYGLN